MAVGAACRRRLRCDARSGVARRNSLESELDELKKRKDFMRLPEYEKRRDEIVIEIARVSRKIRTEQAGRS